VDDEAWLRPRAYQAFTVLTFCRALYVLHFGAVTSKPQAAAWAETAYPRWKPQIEQSQAWRADHTDGDPRETISFMREALDEVRRQCSEYDS
jgi:Aminoglycoside adenylyltransferase, C-terminal domain